MVVERFPSRERPRDEFGRLIQVYPDPDPVDTDSLAAINGGVSV